MRASWGNLNLNVWNNNIEIISRILSDSLLYREQQTPISHRRRGQKQTLQKHVESWKDNEVRVRELNVTSSLSVQTRSVSLAILAVSLSAILYHNCTHNCSESLRQKNNKNSCQCRHAPRRTLRKE